MSPSEDDLWTTSRPAHELEEQVARDRAARRREQVADWTQDDPAGERGGEGRTSRPEASTATGDEPQAAPAEAVAPSDTRTIADDARDVTPPGPRVEVDEADALSSPRPVIDPHQGASVERD